MRVIIVTLYFLEDERKRLRAGGDDEEENESGEVMSLRERYKAKRSKALDEIIPQLRDYVLVVCCYYVCFGLRKYKKCQK